MKYAICNETFCDWPLDKSLGLARDCGYTGWEIAPFTLTDDIRGYSQSDRATYRRLVEQGGFEIIGLHWLLAKTEGLYLTTEDVETRRRTSDYLCELARLCSDLGGQTLVLGSPQQRNVPDGQSMDSAMKCAADVIREAADEFAKQSVKLAIEPLGREEGNFLNLAADGRRLIQMIDHPHVRLHLDVKAMSDEPTPTPQIIRDNADLMIHFHANDPNRQGPGMGDVDFVPIFAALSDIDYQGWVSVEVFDYTPGIERLVTESMSNMVAAQTAASI